MNDLEKLIDERIEGVRGWIELEATDRDDDVILDSIAWVRGGMSVCMIPTIAHGTLLMEIFGFVDGAKVGEWEVLLRDA